MGGSSSKQNFWPPTKLFKKEQRNKSSKKRHSRHGNGRNPPPPEAPMYDTVAGEVPVYAVVDKSGLKKNAVEENVQYAEIEVIRQSRGQTKKKPPILPKPAESTEYATINFSPPRSPSPPKVHSPKHQVNTTNKDRVRTPYNAANGTLV